MELFKIKTCLFLQELKIIGSAYLKNPSVELIFDFDSNLPEFIYAERTSLQQIVANLVSNSIKFTANGYVRLHVFRDDIYIYFVCEDSGTGMSPSFIKEKLFHPFSQENLSNTSRVRGLGLGLALSKHLIEQMNGKLEVKSELNEGTIMTVSLPLTPSNSNNITEYKYNLETPQIIELMNAQNSDLPQVPSSILRRETSQSALVPSNQLLHPEHSEYLDSPKTALVIDDNYINRQILSQLLKHNGFECIEASGGREAISILMNSKNQIHIILLVTFLKK